MEIVIIFVLVLLLVRIQSKKMRLEKVEKEPYTQYEYHAKEHLMTPTEEKLYFLLSSAVFEKYLVFPQIHLSAILDHKITGQNYTWAFRNINQYSVDYVLCDKQTLKPSYAIELDDYTHGQPKRIDRDKKVESILQKAGIPLVRFSDKSPSKEEIIRKLHDARFLTMGR